MLRADLGSASDHEEVYPMSARVWKVSAVVLNAFPSNQSNIRRR